MIDEETLFKVMGEYVPKSSRYVSCIRIDGKPILPPLITDEYRKELFHQRNLAVSVEKKLRETKVLIDNRQSVDSGIIASTNDQSWLNRSVLESQKDLNSPCSGFSDKSVNFAVKKPSHTDMTENASSKTLICEDDMWRYLSNCSSEQFNSVCIEVGEHSIDSNASGDFTVREVSQLEKRSQNDSLCKSLQKLESNDVSELLPDNIDEHDNKTHEIEKNVKTHSDSCVENCIVNNRKGTSELLSNHIDLQLKSLNSTITGSSEITHKDNEFDGFSCNEICCKDTVDSDEKFSDSKSEEKEVALDETEVMSKQGEKGVSFSHIDGPPLDRKNNLLLPVSTLTKSLVVKDLECMVEQKTNLGNGDSQQNSDFFNSSCIVSRSLQENIEINSPRLPGLVYSPCFADGDDRKTEKYNPLKYSSSKKCIEICHAEKECEDDFVLDSENVNRRSSGEVDIIETDSTFTEPGGNSVQELSVNLDCNSVSQKVGVETPLSESTSFPEIDFQSCSFATVSQDTPDDTSELCNETNIIKNDDEFCSPKLVRQNSYTLIAPSPVLLAHAKASEKLDTIALSEDEKSGSSQVKIPRKSWDVAKAKNEWNSVKGVKYVYAVPQSSDQDSVIKESSFKLSDRKSSKCKVSSLPGSSVTSPIKINPYFSSVDNLPMVNVRKFQEYISSKSNVVSLSEVSSEVPSRNNELIEQKDELSHSSTFLDIILNKNNDLRKTKTNLNDIICVEKTNEGFFSGDEFKENQDNNCTNIEETYKCTNFSQSSTNIDQGEMAEEMAPKNCHSYQNDSENNCIVRPNDVPNFSDHRNLKNVPENDDSSKHLNPSAYDNTVQQVFLQLQNQHSHLMAQLLDRQKKEQEALANTFLNQQRLILRELRLIPAESTERKQASSNVDVSHRSLDTCKKSPQVLSEHQFKDSASREPCPSTLKTPRTLEKIPLYENSYDITMKGGGSADLIPHYKERQLFTLSASQHQRISEYSEDQNKAATTINAFARGYLVRRLLKTEYVQEIIKTISESVMCALQLQRECPVDITPSDVELHRRLIQQLTAACHSLHETFFSLSIQEKMIIIANDREKRQMQVARPMSAKSAISAATQKYLQRKQQQQQSSRQSDRPVSTTRRSWWRNKGRASSAGNCELSSSCHAKQPNVMSSKQQSCSIRSTRRPWR